MAELRQKGRTPKEIARALGLGTRAAEAALRMPGGDGLVSRRRRAASRLGLRGGTGRGW